MSQAADFFLTVSIVHEMFIEYEHRTKLLSNATIHEHEHEHEHRRRSTNCMYRFHAPVSTTEIKPESCVVEQYL
jgi:hypothetical protein